MTDEQANAAGGHAPAPMSPGALFLLFLKIGSTAFGGFMALLSAAMAVGLWTVRTLARIAQIVIAALGVLTCSFTLPSVAALVYMLRAGVRDRFATGQGPGDSNEGLFTGLILGTVALGVLLATGGWALLHLVKRETWRSRDIIPADEHAHSNVIHRPEGSRRVSAHLRGGMPAVRNHRAGGHARPPS